MTKCADCEHQIELEHFWHKGEFQTCYLCSCGWRDKELNPKPSEHEDD